MHMSSPAFAVVLDAAPFSSLSRKTLGAALWRLILFAGMKPNLLILRANM